MMFSTRTPAAVMVAALVLTGCAAQADERILKDPRTWPLAGLSGTATRKELPDGAEKAVARIRTGSFDLAAWINDSGDCGLAQQGTGGYEWSMSVGLTKSEGATTSAEEGFSGPAEPAAGSASESTVFLFCTPTRMLITIKTKKAKQAKIVLDGHAAAKPVDDAVLVVVGTPAACKESLPDATVTTS
jgi:hypothetical protein